MAKPPASARHRLTPSFRGGILVGWTKRINGAPKWICSAGVAPTGALADAYYEKHFAELWVPTAAPPAEDPQDTPMVDLCNLYLKRQRDRVGILDGIGQRTYDEYEEALNDFCQFSPSYRSGRKIGRLAFREIIPDDFGAFHRDLGERFGLDRFKKFVTIIRSTFKWLGGDDAPIRLPLPRYGGQFSLPSKRAVRIARKKAEEDNGVKAFEPVEIQAQLSGRRLTCEEIEAEKKRREQSHRGMSTKFRHNIKGANTAMRAMILGAINCGFGNTDLAELPQSVAERAIVDEWIDYARTKTGAPRLAWLWPETRAAWKKYLAGRPEPAKPEFAGLFFLTRFGLPYVRAGKDQIGMQYQRLLRMMRQKRARRSFYSLRRTYRSIACEIGKELIIDYSMGHVGDDSDMARVYTVTEQRTELKRIAQYVRRRVLNT